VEEINGQLVVEHMWLTLIEETPGDSSSSPRSLLVLSPFFRIRSFMPGQRLGRISTAQQLLTKDTSAGDEDMTSFVLPGKGSHRRVNFRGDLKATHHLHFTSK